jgi:hypothetical protein
MENISTIKAYYERASSIELVQLSRKPQELEPQVLPLLLNELSKRKETEAANELKAFVEGKSKLPIHSDFSFLTEEEKAGLLEEVKERLVTGELVESIRIDLFERGIDITNLFSSDGNQEELLHEFITKLRMEQRDYLEIKEILVKEKGFSESDAGISIIETQEMGKRNHEKGIWYIVIGSVIFIGSLMLAISGDGGLVILPYGAIFAGISMIAIGAKQKLK